MINLKKILVPTDFSDSARHALSYGISFAREYDAELTLLHVVETVAVGYASDLFPVPMAEVFQEISGYARTELTKLADEARGRGARVKELVTQGKPAADILRVAREDAIDMIVLGTHGKGVLDHALFGSTTERVVRKAPCPVLTCRLSEHEFVTEEPSASATTDASSWPGCGTPTRACRRGRPESPRRRTCRPRRS
jgi:nucleotide-binding universal stress UspA family protein